MKKQFKYFTYDPEDNSFEEHETEEEAKKVASEILESYRSEAVDYGWSELTGGICYGKIMARAVITKENKPETPPCGNTSGVHCTDCLKGDNNCQNDEDLCIDYDSENTMYTTLEYEIKSIEEECKGNTK